MRKCQADLCAIMDNKDYVSVFYYVDMMCERAPVFPLLCFLGDVGFFSSCAANMQILTWRFKKKNARYKLLIYSLIRRNRYSWVAIISPLFRLGWNGFASPRQSDPSLVF